MYAYFTLYYSHNFSVPLKRFFKIFSWIDRVIDALHIVRISEKLGEKKVLARHVSIKW